MKIVRIIGICIALCTVFASMSASSEFYRYIDENGKVRYTDDIGNVPKDQREGIRKYTGYKSEPEQKPDEAGTETKPAPPQGYITPEDQKSLQDTKARLDAFKKDLDDEYNAILTEKKQVDLEREKATAPDQIKAYNQNVIGLNDRIDQYENKQKKYNEDVQLYNNRLKELTEGASPPDAGEKK